MKTLLASVLMVAACAQSKTPVGDDFSSLAGMDEKSDSFSYRMKLLGSLDYGHTTSASYSKTPRYRALKFAGNAGDQVDVWVRSDDGDAVAWVLDNSFRVLGSNDDADDTTLDAHVSVTLPASTSSITHYIVFRDYALAPANFTVDLAGTPAAQCQIDADCAGTSVADGQVPECNFGTHQCEGVLISDIHCGGFIANVHQCPTGYACQLLPHPDAGGHCEQQP